MSRICSRSLASILGVTGKRKHAASTTDPQPGVQVRCVPQVFLLRYYKTLVISSFGNQELPRVDPRWRIFSWCSKGQLFTAVSEATAHRLNSKMAELRRSGDIPWLRLDSKTQVTVHYEQKDGAVIPKRVHTIVISVQHDDIVTLEEQKRVLKEKVIKAVVPAKYLDDKTIYHLQPSGRFVIGGPQGDAGVTGRKIIVDTYGGWGAHGGGAFSGKDFSKVDRSAAYAARWVATSLVKAKLSRRVLVQVSYAIGVAHPLSISLFTYGSSQKTESELLQIVKNNFDLRPGVIVRELNLKRPIYQQTASYGHFGRPEFTWEVPKKLIY